MKKKEIIKRKIKNSSNENELKRYLISSSSTRFYARIFDIFVLLIILFFTGISIFYVNVNSLNSNITYGSFIGMIFGKGLQKYSSSEISIMFDGWKYCIFTWELFILFFIWFIIIPYFLKGRTIGKIIFKTTTIDLSDNKNLFFWHLIKKEFFLWIIDAIILLIYGFVCLGLKSKAYRFNLSYINDANTNGFQDFNTIYIFVFLFSICLLINLLIIVWMFFNSHKMNLQDHFSSTTVIALNNLDQKEKVQFEIKPNVKNEQKNVLPGEVNLKELDKLIKTKKDKNR